MERTAILDKMSELTEDQQRTLALDRHISVTANAGSGKTKVLVERYVEAIKGGSRVEEILCLTFTEKAALELRQRIIERINQESGYILGQARANMLEANISTIHSFCSQLLREFPIEAGVDANFKVLEDFDASVLKEESCEKAVRQALEEEHEISGKYHDFLVRVGYERTLQLLNDLLDSREKIEHIRNSSYPLILSKEAIQKRWEELLGKVLSVLKENVRLREGERSAEVRGLIDSVLTGTGNTRNQLSNLKILLDKVLTKTGMPRKQVVEKIDEGVSFSSKTAASILEIAFDALKDFSFESFAIEKYLSLVNTLIEFYKRAEEQYSRKKFSLGALDFDDLQIQTMKLIKTNDPVRTLLSSRFKHIMVDEFQDTNFLQYDIFSCLLGDFSTNAKLFVVGDPKQSIYRFRNAQVEVSLKVNRDLARRPDGLSLELAESFRMNSSLASFVNQVFSNVMARVRYTHIGSDETSAVIKYNALVPRRKKSLNDVVEIFLVQSTRSRQMDANNADGENLSDFEEQFTSSELQAKYVAMRIRKMISDRETINDAKLDEQVRNIGYSDIAVLLRSRSRLTLLEKALSEAAIPYTVTSGIGFYSAQEIFDLSNYLTFLLDNDSDIALLTVLRSPLFGISENELYQASLADGDTLFEKFTCFARSDKASYEVRYAASVLENEIQLAHRMTIPDLLNRILERTGWLGAYSLSPTGGQRIANMRKLLNIAREFEGRGFNSLYDFVERLKNLRNAREGQAPVEETTDAVKIMTIHAAKGLEFPVVIIPFCDVTVKNHRDLLVNDHVGVLPFISNVADLTSAQLPSELSLFKEFESEEDQAEIVRLFYVACTRAMEKLVITTPSKASEPKSINSFTDILRLVFDISTVPSSGYFQCSESKARVLAELPSVNEDSISLKVMSDEKVEPGSLFVGSYVDPIQANVDGEIFSATLLQTFKLCPTRYFLKYHIGLPTAEEGNAGREAHNQLDEYDDSILSTVKGEIVHKVLHDLLARGTYSELDILAVSRKVVADRIWSSIPAKEVDGLVDQVFQNAKNATTTLASILRRGKNYLEQTITKKFGNDFITGTLDLLVRDDSGFHIYDYKTDRLDKKTADIYAEYETQMKFYAALCSSLDTQQESFDVTIVFTREAGKYLVENYSREQLVEFENELRSMIQRIKEIEASTAFYPLANDSIFPTATPYCSKCDFFVGGVEKMCLFKRI
jgi:ATP-dependent helicase/nuclease subunit A